MMINDDLQQLLLPYQVRWLLDDSAIKISEKSRRIGITWTEGLAAVLAASGVDGVDSWYIGYEKTMAEEFINGAAEWARLLNEGFLEEKTEECILDEESGKSILTYRIRLASGHKITALSSRPSNLRGKKGRVIIDEAAQHQDLEATMAAAPAITMWGGKIRIISTHYGVDNYFAEIVRRVRDKDRPDHLPYSLHKTTLDDALNEGLFKKICQSQGIAWSKEAEEAWRAECFAQYPSRTAAEEELLCIPARSGGEYFSTALIESRTDPGIPILRWECDKDFAQQDDQFRTSAAEKWCRDNIETYKYRLHPDSMSFFGLDFGRDADLSVIWVLQLHTGNVRKTPFLIELRNVPFRQQEQILIYLADRLPRFTAAALDAGGNGQYLAEQAYQRYGSRVEPIKFGLDWYRENMPKYRAAFEDAQIDLPKDLDVLNDHRSVKLEDGIARVAGTRTRGTDGKGRHGDSVIAGVLAWYASIKGVGYSCAYQPGTAPDPVVNRNSVRPNPYGKTAEELDAWDDLQEVLKRRRRRSGHGLVKGYTY